MQRNFLPALFVACLFLTLIKVLSSGKLPSAAKTEINFWNGWTGPDGVAMLDVIREFNRENPDIQVSMQRMDWGTYYNKLMVSTMAHRGPEVFVIHASSMPRMARAGFVGDISDVFGPSFGLVRSDFEPKVLDQVMFGGRTLGLPLDIHPQGLYCDADLFRQAGLVNPNGTIKVPKTRADFLQTIRATQHTLPDGDHDTWGFSWTMWRFNFMSLVPQFGGRFLDEQGRPDLANPGNVQALQFMGDLVNRDKLTPTPESNMAWTGYRQKKVAMVFEGVYMIGDLKTLDGFHAVGAPVPRLGSRKGTLADSHCLCLRGDLTSKTRAAAERFIAFLSNNSLAWAQAGQVPARKSIRDSDGFRKLQVQYAFSKEIPYITYPPKTPLLFEFNDQVDLAVEKVLRGRTTAKDALELANRNLEAAFARDEKESLQ